MGNEIAKDYEVHSEACGTWGRGQLWQVYPARHRKTRAAGSLHVFSKDALKRLPKAQRERVLDTFRADIKSVTS